MASAKFEIYEQIAELGRALGSAHRWELLEHVSQGERSVDRLASLAGLSVANTSAHLQQLRRGGLVQSRRDGKRVLYRLADGSVAPLLAAMRRCAESNRAEVREIVTDYFGRLDRLDPVSREELDSMLASGEVTVLDVRPTDEFELGHVPGALNVPLAELRQRLGSFSRGQEIVAYCRGPYCVLSFEAVAMLRAEGFGARRLEEGFPEWKAAGLAIEATAS